MSNWQAGTIKSHLRTTIQRLGQLQQKKDSLGAITRRDIATLLKNGNINLARTKTYNLILEDVSGDLLEKLEMYLGVILERLSEIEASAPTPNVVEAAATIIMAAPHVDSKDLHSVRDYLIHRLGLDFARSAMSNREQHVSPKVAAAIASPPPSASKLDAVMVNIAQTYGIDWQPEPQRHDILPSLSELLDPALPFVDLARLRKLCSYGIPDEPSWLRPRIWKLLLGLVPSSRATTQTELQKQRDSYYDLIRRLLDPLSSLPSPTAKLASQDDAILSVYRQLSRVPSNIFSYGLDEQPDTTVVTCLDTDAPSELKIACSDNLDNRLQLLQSRNKEGGDSQNPPELRLEVNDTPEISLTAPDSPKKSRKTRSSTKDPTTLVPSQVFNSIRAHPKHTSALLRLLYIHSSINPGNFSPHLPSLLVVLYHTINQEVEVDDLSHVEADTFWLFETMVGEFSELEDEEGGKIWMSKFSDRLNWADTELAENLNAKGLNPTLPHYSYRWLAPLLTHTLPLPAVLPIWDAILARNMRERESNPKLDFFMDICTAMLIRVKAPILRLGSAALSGRAPGLWEDITNRPALSPSGSGDAFLEGVSMLEMYPLEAAGGVDRIIQSAGDLAYQRLTESYRSQKTPSLSLGERLKVTMWRGFTNQESSPIGSPASEKGDPIGFPPIGIPALTSTASISSTGISSRLASTVWRGITNQSSMEVPPSPVSPVGSVVFPRPSPRAESPTSPPRSPSPPPPTSLEPEATSIWQYAAQLRDSDAAAKLAKVGSNLKAKAIVGSWSLSGGSTGVSTVPNTPQSSIHPVTPTRTNSMRRIFVPSSEPVESRRGSLPIGDRSGLYSPPARPSYFRPPRDSVLPGSLHFPSGSDPGFPDLRPEQEGLMGRARNLQETLTSLTRKTPGSPEPVPKAAPRPLLLGGSSVVAAKATPSKRVTDGSESGDWAEVMRAKARAIHRDSQSSISSLSPSDALRLGSGTRSDWDSDGGSRKVPLNRRSISPMAPNYRTQHSRPASASSMSSSEPIFLSPVTLSPSIPEAGLRSQGTSSPASERGWGRIDVPDSPPVVVSPQPQPLAPNLNLQDSAILTDATTVPLKMPDNMRRPSRKKTPINEESEAGETSEASLPSQPLARAQRIRSKRRPADIRVQQLAPSGDVGRSPNTLNVDWPEEQLDLSATPTATKFVAFPPRSKSPKPTKKLSGEGNESGVTRQRKVSAEERTRKTSGSRPRKISTSKRESAAVEGDDEGYDDLLSAYESEVPDELR